MLIVQVKVHNQYTAEDFDEDLRGVLRRSGCRVCVDTLLYTCFAILLTLLLCFRVRRFVSLWMNQTY